MNNIVKIKSLFLTTVSVLAISCASSSKEISAIYVSPTQYNQFNCEQISQELARLNGRKIALAADLDEKASGDKGMTAVSAILFWPAAFALGGNEGQETEYARLKGEYDAVQQSGIEKNCKHDPTLPVKSTNIVSKSNDGESVSAIDYYGEAEEEVNSESYDKNLWAKAFVLVEGDEQKRKSKYIELRANQLYSKNLDLIENSNLDDQ